MNTNRKRIASGAVSVALVGGIVAAALTLGPAMAATPAPTSTYVVPAGEIVNVDDAISDLEAEAAAAEAARVEAERVAAEAAAAEAARVEAERVAAEAAAAEQAARDAAAPAPQAPAAPAPAPAQPGGDQQAGECREYNDANECTAYYTP